MQKVPYMAPLHPHSLAGALTCMQNLNKIYQTLFKLESGNQVLRARRMDKRMDTQMEKHNTPSLSCGGV